MIRINSCLPTFEAGVRFKTNDLSFRAGWRIERIETRRVDAVIPRPKRSRIGGVREEKSEEGWPRLKVARHGAATWEVLPPGGETGN